jgi:hypothetical protein
MGYVLGLKGTTSIVSAVKSLLPDNYNNYILSVHLGRWLKMLSFDSSTFVYTQVGGDYDCGNGFNAYAMATDGIYYYVGVKTASNTNVVLALSFDGASFTLKGTLGLSTLGVEVMTIICDTLGFVHVCNTQGTMRAYSFDGTNFTLITTYQSLNAYPFQTVYNGTYFYRGDMNISSATGLIALTFNGTSYAVVGSSYYSSTQYPDATKAVYYDGLYIISQFYTGLYAHTFNGSTFSQVGNTFTINSSSVQRYLSYDGQYYYLATSGSGVRVFTFNGTNFTELTPFSDTSLSVVNGRTIDYFKGCMHFIRSTGIYAIRMNLSAQFTASKLSGYAPLSVTFTAT